jgi:hypothetical protein
MKANTINHSSHNRFLFFSGSGSGFDTTKENDEEKETSKGS